MNISPFSLVVVDIEVTISFGLYIVIILFILWISLFANKFLIEKLLLLNLDCLNIGMKLEKNILISKNIIKTDN